MENEEVLKLISTMEKSLEQLKKAITKSKDEIIKKESISDSALAKEILNTLKKFKYEGTAKYIWIQKKFKDFRGNPDRKTGEPIKNYYITKDTLVVTAVDSNQKPISAYEIKSKALKRFRKELNKRGLNEKDDEWYPFIVSLELE